jgi:cytochrome c biogenesis protein CcmG/thiol:disulfide interchange protein DsbE
LRTINRHRTILSILILCLGLVWIAISAEGQVSTDRSTPAPRPGFPAPNFSLVNLDGQEVQLGDFQGHPLVVNFWASWCPPCRAEMPAFQKIFAEYEPQGFVILAVNSQESRANAFDFTQSHGLTFPVLLDEDGDVSNHYRVVSLPSTFFINRDGVISEVVYGGPISEAYLRIQVEKLLKEDH